MELNVKYGAADKYIDVTHKFIEKNFFDGENIRIPYGTHFNFFFGDPYPGVTKYLYITFNNLKYVIHEKYPRSTFIKGINSKVLESEKIPDIKQEINIVYFAYIKDLLISKNIVFGQLRELLETKLLSHAKLFICLTFDNCFTQEYVGDIKNILQDCNGEFEISLINQYEYIGIRKVWQIAQKFPESLILYFHSKGMIFGNPKGISYKRTFPERCLFNHTVKPWQNILKIFENKTINKVGYICSSKGFCWFNFWWVRASYLLDFVEPIVTPDRFYYERYLGEQKGVDKDCYNLFDNSIAAGVEAITVSHMINDHILEISDDWMPDF